MSQVRPFANPKKAYVKNSSLILLAFSTAFFSRIFCSVTHAPSALNFLHFLTVPLAFGVALATSRTKNQQQIAISKSLLFGLLLLLAVMTASALLNSAGVINVVVDFMLLAEPFMLLLAIVCIPMSATCLRKIQVWLACSVLINLLLAYIQKPLIASGRLYTVFGDTDGVQGVFFESGAGNYVSASVSVNFALYYFTTAKTVPLWMRGLALLAALWQLQISDSKQIVFTYIVAWVLLVLINFKDIGKALKLLIAIVLVCLAFLWCVENLEAFKAFTAWARPELYAPGGDANIGKFAGIRFILSYYKTPLNWLLGLGPGHTIGRLGGWFLKDYWSLLGPLGATTHPVSSETMDFMFSFWLTGLTGSSMFNPFFGWAGIWGDLGFLGLGAYLYLSFLVWRYLCFDDLLKFTLLTIFVIGLIFTQMEEPGYMLSMAMLVGLRWQEQQIERRTQTLAKAQYLSSMPS